jgi:hypothetical protein
MTDRYLENVLEYCNCYLKEYKSVLENNYKVILDEVRNKKLVEKVFKLYGYKTVIPYSFMYDYGTWIFFTVLSNPKCIIKYDDQVYNKDWSNIHLQDYKRRAILKELNINEKDVIKLIIIEGCKFLDRPDRDYIYRSAVAHARSEIRTEVSTYEYKKRHKWFNLKNFARNIFSKKNIFLVILLVAVFLIGFFFGNFGRLKYTKKISLFGFEIELSDKYFEKETASKAEKN